MRPGQLGFYYAALALTNVTRGACIVAQAWSAALVGAGLAGVGQIFVVSHAVIILCGPVVGVMIDRYSRRHLAIIGQLLIGCATLIPWLWVSAGWPLSLWALVFVAAGSSLGYVVMSGALDAIQQAVGERKDQPRISAVAGSIRQGFMIAGSGIAGLGIHYLSPAAAYLFCSLFCVIAAGLIYFLPDARVNAVRRGTVLTEVAIGLRELNAMPAVLRIGLLTAIGFSVGQLSNVLLPNFVRDELGGDSRLFGIVDALWSVGGVLSPLLLARFIGLHRLSNVEYWSAILLGLVTALVWSVERPTTLMIAYFFLGCLFSVTKVVCDGRVLEICAEEVVGRVRTHIQSLISVVGLFIYLSPSILPIRTASASYLLWGSLVALCAAALFWTDMKARTRDTGLQSERTG